MKILVTGCAGFVGMHMAAQLLTARHTIVGIDSVDSYYDPVLKEDRLKVLAPLPGFEFHRFDLADLGALSAVFAAHRFDRVLHLAAQAGVRHSLVDPHAYVRSNLVAFVNLLECCRAQQVAHLVYASSSSVYGANAKLPFASCDAVDHPVSLYAATKRSNELLAHSYSQMFLLPTTGLRFFTVYGPWGRPDMAMTAFTAAILAGRPIPVFNSGDMLRNFTYVDDIVTGVVRVLDHIPRAQPVGSASYRDPAHSAAPFHVFNLGSKQPAPLLDMIRLLAAALGKEAILNPLPMQPGDIAKTSADTTDLEAAIGFSPATPLAEGIRHYVAWHRAYYE